MSFLSLERCVQYVFPMRLQHFASISSTRRTTSMVASSEPRLATGGVLVQSLKSYPRLNTTLFHRMHRLWVQSGNLVVEEHIRLLTLTTITSYLPTLPLLMNIFVCMESL